MDSSTTTPVEKNVTVTPQNLVGQDPTGQEEVTATTICEDLWALLRTYKAHMSKVAEQYKLTIIQFSALHAISDGKTTMGKVAQALHCDASNATGIIDRLTALNFVMRQDNPTDRRVKSLVLTDEGQSVLGKILKEMPNALGCDSLSGQERCTMHDMLTRLAEPR